LIGCVLNVCCSSPESKHEAPNAPRASRETEDARAADAGEDWSYGVCPDTDAIGHFTLLLADDYTGFQGSVADAVLPSDVLRVVAEAGDCKLLERPIWSCDACDVATQTCAMTGCVPFPKNQDVGRVVVAGLVAPLQMQPSAHLTYTNPPNFPHPGFEPNAPIALDASGGALPSFTLHGVGVKPLRSSTPGVHLKRESAAKIEWQVQALPPAVADRIGVVLLLTVNRHGSSAGWIRCESADDGSLEIPSTLIDGLFDRGLSGWPTLELRRQSSETVQLGTGCVDFAVRSSTTFDVSVEGLTSCNTSDDCPSGQSCSADLSCQ
jgi:hypothetical protein